MLADQIRVFEKLQHALKMQDKDNEQVGQRPVSDLGISILENFNVPFWERLVSELSSLIESQLSKLMTVCDQLIEKFEHLQDGDSQSEAIHMANCLFHELEGILSRLVSLEATVGITLQSVKEQAPAKSETNWIFDLIIKLKKIEEHTRKVWVNVYDDKLEKLKEFIRVLEKLEHELKLEPKENGKLWKGLESEFSSMMTLCDQLNEKYEHLYDAMTADERSMSDVVCSYSSDSSDSPNTHFNFIVFSRKLETCEMVCHLFKALDKLNEPCFRLVSPERTVGNCGKGLQTLDIEKEKEDYHENNVPTLTEDKENNVINIKSHDILVEQLEMAKTSKIPVVILFNSKSIKPSKEYLPKFYDLPNHYRNFDGDIKFLRVDVKQAATEFEVRAYPTVLMLMPGSFGLRVVGELSIEETVIVPAFVNALKPRLDKLLWQYCGYMGAMQQA